MKGLVIAAIAAAAGLVLATAINTETDKQLEQIDSFIEAHQVEDELITDLAPASLEPTEDWVEMSPEEFQVAGIIDWNGWRYTYYSEQVLPGEGLNIPGRWSDGTFVRDENGYLCVASNINDLPFGTYVDTPFGAGIVYDCGCDPGIIDIYVSFN
jgi:hypothetical protein